MKNSLIAILLFVAILMGWLYYDTLTTGNTEKRVLESEIRGHKMRADSISVYAQSVKDSLEISFVTIKNLNAEKEQAHQETTKWIKRYESIKFKPLANNRERDSVLRVLYPNSFENDN